MLPDRIKTVIIHTEYVFFGYKTLAGDFKHLTIRMKGTRRGCLLSLF